MTNPTRQEIINAHDAAEGLKNAALPTADFCGDKDKFLMWHKDILKALPPKPRPTMADVEWDDDKHYLAEAEHHPCGLVTMIGPVGQYDKIQCTFRNDDGINTIFSIRDYLTPTGRRYTLTEVQDG